ncbi:restriction endonuclease subunit S [Neisseria shayeganii]|uniref:Type I restriction-modification enzyme S subunit n=1 Tax=Neisseria shayeganii 871 TaxID=1032488 RepID=G4CIS1_9NEIS|nr:restriction endonuclease subunit S [Neisseria shayeganii]EGY52318.1 type I restriction-modification enzyme S subunit [Neisseria shayeganii 871]
MHTPQLSDNLRRALLQAAIEGKLSERQADDGHAQDLLKQIQAEKAALLKAGRLKKSKGLPEIGEDEKPFAIPENWVWVRLGEITFNRGQKAPDKDFSYIDIASIDNTKQKMGSKLAVVPAKDAPSRARKIVCKGDILYATVRPYLLNMCIVEHEISPEPIASTGFAVLCTPYPILNKYLFRVLMSPFFDGYANSLENAKGVAYPAINDSRLMNGLIPLPPLAEQTRIVAKLDALLAETDALKAQETALADAQKNFPKMLRASLLQAAIEGKLTERESEDGHAQELLEQIQAEKAAQIQAGRLKKSKGLPEIGEDEKPFAIPKNWVWVRLGDLAQILNGDRGKNYPGKNFWIDKGKPFINAGSLNNSVLDNNGFNYISEERYSLLRAGFIQKNDFLYCLRGSLGKFSLNRDFNEGVIGSSLCIIRTINAGLIPFIFYYLQTDLASEGIKQVSNGTAQPNLSAENVRSFLFPLPPLAEQARIVAKLDALLAQIELLENLS